MTIPKIDSRVEKALRDGLDYAAKGMRGELGRYLLDLGEDIGTQAVELSASITGYTAISVCGRVWPGEENRHKIAIRVASLAASANNYQVDEQDVHAFLDRVCLRFEALNAVFPDPEQAVTLPFVVTAHLLAAYCPRGMSMWDYLDQVEGALEAAWVVDVNLLPALMLRNAMPQPKVG